MLEKDKIVKYKNLETQNIINESRSFAEQFRLRNCEELELETVERLIYIIASYIEEEGFQIDLSIMSYNNYYNRLAGQKYTEEDIERGVKTYIISRLNDIYECNSFEDAQNTLLNRSFKLIEQASDLGEKVWIEKVLRTNRYLSPLLHFLGIKKDDNISYFVSADRFPKNYPIEKIHSIFKEMFSNIREATIRNLEPTRIEDFTDEQRADRGFRRKIIKALNKGINMNLSENIPHNPTVRFAEEPQIIIYRDEDVDNSRKRKSPEKPNFTEMLLNERRDEFHRSR